MRRTPHLDGVVPLGAGAVVSARTRHYFSTQEKIS